MVCASFRLEEGLVTPLIASYVSCAEHHGGQRPDNIQPRKSIQEASSCIRGCNPDEKVGSLHARQSKAQRCIWKFGRLPLWTYGDESSDLSTCRDAPSQTGYDCNFQSHPNVDCKWNSLE